MGREGGGGLDINFVFTYFYPKPQNKPKKPTSANNTVNKLLDRGN